MVIKGGARGGPVGLAAHLERTDENERVTLIGIHGLAARDVEGALIEMDALGAGLKTSRTLYHVSINVGYSDRMSEERWQSASAALREKLDLAGQPYIEIEHEKKGRTHRHFVVSRTDIEHNRAIRADHNYRTHEEVARDLERQFGHERVQGAHVERDGKDRPERTPSYAEMQQAKRTGITPEEAKEFVTGLWQTTDSGKAFNAALEAHGWMLARGDKRDFVLLDPQGETHSVARRVEGAKAKDIRARMADLDPDVLPGVEASRSLQKDRAAEKNQSIEKQAAPSTPEIPYGKEPGMQPGIVTAANVKREPANENVQEPVTLEAMQRDPWNAVYGTLPQDADRTLLAATAMCADQCAKSAFAAARANEVIQPQLAEYCQDRQADALARRNEARATLAALPPEQVAKVSPFLHPEQLQDRALTSLREAIGERAAEMGLLGYLNEQSLDRTPWNALTQPLPPYASPELFSRVFETTVFLSLEADQRREAAYTPEEAGLWDVLNGDLNRRRYEIIGAERSQDELVNRAEAGLAKGHYDELRHAQQEAKAPQQARQAERENQPQPSDAIDADAQKGRQQPGDSAGRDTRGGGPEPSGGPPRPEAEDMRPLGKVAGEIRAAWRLSRSAEELEEALAARGIGLAEVSAEEAQQSQRTAAFAREVGNFERVLREKEIVAVDQYGEVHRFDQRTTGDLRPEIEARFNGFGGIDRAGLLTVAGTREVVQEAARAAWKDEQRIERDMARPLTGIETTIADALANSMTGTEFAEALDKAGITIARATAADIPALDALRDEADLAATVAFTSDMDVNRDARHYDKIAEGDYAAVTGSGDVFRLNPTALDFEEAEQRLADVQPRLPSVTEARALNEQTREQSAGFWADLREWNAEARAERNAAFESDRALYDTVNAGERGVEHTLHAADDAVNAGLHAALSGFMAKAVEKVLAGVFSFFGGGEPKLTQQQARDQARADSNEETLYARAAAEAEEAKMTDQDWRIFEQDRQQQQEELAREMGYRERPGDRERERERDWP